MWEAGLHCDRIKFETEEVNNRPRPERLCILKAKPKLAAKGHHPLNRRMSETRRGANGEKHEEVVQIMPDTSRNVALDDPVQSLSKEVKNVRRCSKAKGEHQHVIETLTPLESEKIPIGHANGNVTESVFQIKLCHEGALARHDEILHGSLEAVVLDETFLWGNAIIHRG
jgi:hypothetical protein